MTRQYGHQIPKTNYNLELYNCRIMARKAFLTLQTYCQSCDTCEGPNVVDVPSEKTVNEFMEFMAPYFKKYNIDAKYQMFTVAQE